MSGKSGLKNILKCPVLFKLLFLHKNLKNTPWKQI